MGGLEVPGEEVYNLTVIKEKSIFQDEGLHCVSDQEVGQGPAEGNRSRH